MFLRGLCQFTFYILQKVLLNDTAKSCLSVQNDLVIDDTLEALDIGIQFNFKIVSLSCSLDLTELWPKRHL